MACTYTRHRSMYRHTVRPASGPFSPCEAFVKHLSSFHQIHRSRKAMAVVVVDNSLRVSGHQSAREIYLPSTFSGLKKLPVIPLPTGLGKPWAFTNLREQYVSNRTDCLPGSWIPECSRIVARRGTRPPRLTSYRPALIVSTPTCKRGQCLSPRVSFREFRVASHLEP